MSEFDGISREVAAIRHRVADCFRSLADLARTSAADGACDQARWALDRVDEQVRSISHVQAMLVGGMARGLTDHLQSVASLWSRIGRDRGVEVLAQMDRVPASPGHLAAPFAMIANTALSNCFDHAFPEGRTGLVKIGLGGTVAGGLCLTVIDDGVGWDRDPAAGSGRGCRLIRDLAESIGGRAEWRPHPLGGGIVSVLVLPVPQTPPP